MSLFGGFGKLIIDFVAFTSLAQSCPANLQHDYSAAVQKTQSYDTVLIGEIHGHAHSIGLMNAVARDRLSRGQEVVLFIEAIPDERLIFDQPIADHGPRDFLQSAFWTKNIDNRASCALFKFLEGIFETEGVTIRSLWVDKSHPSSLKGHDMAAELLRHAETHPDAALIALTGGNYQRIYKGIDFEDQSSMCWMIKNEGGLNPICLRSGGSLSSKQEHVCSSLATFDLVPPETTDNPHFYGDFDAVLVSDSQCVPTSPTLKIAQFNRQSRVTEIQGKMDEAQSR